MEVGCPLGAPEFRLYLPPPGGLHCCFRPLRASAIPAVKLGIVFRATAGRRKIIDIPPAYPPRRRETP